MYPFFRVAPLGSRIHAVLWCWWSGEQGVLTIMRAGTTGKPDVWIFMFISNRLPTVFL